jgi:hypothetical protein
VLGYCQRTQRGEERFYVGFFACSPLKFAVKNVIFFFENNFEVLFHYDNRGMEFLPPESFHERRISIICARQQVRNLGCRYDQVRSQYFLLGVEEPDPDIIIYV